jgi:hypothetical protein
LIARRKQTITEAFYDIGEALREISRKKLYGALGFASFEKPFPATGSRERPSLRSPTASAKCSSRAR